MHAIARIPAIFVVPLMALSLTSCDDAPSSSKASPSASPTAVAANLLHVCDNVQRAFRTGTLPDTEQNSALSTELQGMIDVATPRVAEALRPMVEAADAIALDGRNPARPTLQRALIRAHRDLRDTCVQAGSQAWTN